MHHTLSNQQNMLPHTMEHKQNYFPVMYRNASFFNIVDGQNVFVMVILLSYYRVGEEHIYGFWG